MVRLFSAPTSGTIEEFIQNNPLPEGLKYLIEGENISIGGPAELIDSWSGLSLLQEIS